MARKKSSPIAETEQTPEANGAEPKRGEKSAAIRELIAKGLTSATDISAEMTRQGLSVSMPVIYSLLKKSKKGGRRKMKEAAAPATASVESSQKAPVSPGDLNAKDLNQLAEITKKAGGVEAVVSLLNVVKHFQ